MTIGDRIKQRRIFCGISVNELATILGKNRSTIYRYENSDIENLPTDVLEPLAKALNTSPAYLMGWTNNPTDNGVDKGFPKTVDIPPKHSQWEICDRVRYLRKKALWLSQKEFSKQINITRSSLRDIETGKTKPSECLVSDICQIFNINKKWIVDGIGPIFENIIDQLRYESMEMFCKISDKKHLEAISDYISRLLEEEEENNLKSDK